jgi:hypothetical protein
MPSPSFPCFPSFPESTRPRPLLIAALVLLLSGCGPGTEADAKEPEVTRMTREAYGKSREVHADSVLNAARPVSEIVKDLGADYLEASTKMIDSLSVLSARTDCFATGRSIDPYLAGTVSYSVYMSKIGSTLIQIELSKWSSLAGNVVHSCLNLAAKAWHFGPEFGTRGRQVAQVKFGAHT